MYHICEAIWEIGVLTPPSEPPFSARCCLMGANNGAVDHPVFFVRVIQQNGEARISQMDSQLWYTDVGSILGVAGFAWSSGDAVRSTRWVRAFRMPYVSVSTPP